MSDPSNVWKEQGNKSRVKFQYALAVDFPTVKIIEAELHD